MTKHHTDSVILDHEFPNGLHVEAQVCREWSFDPSYGADADGRRGRPTWFLDDVWLEWSVDIDNGEPVELTREDRDTILDLAAALDMVEGIPEDEPDPDAWYDARRDDRD